MLDGDALLRLLHITTLGGSFLLQNFCVRIMSDATTEDGLRWRVVSWNVNGTGMA